MFTFNVNVNTETGSRIPGHANYRSLQSRYHGTSRASRKDNILASASFARSIIFASRSHNLVFRHIYR